MAIFTGTDGSDIWTGGADDDFAHGGAGDDSLSGAGGNDHLAGEDGSDTLNGGDGDDYLASGPVEASWDIWGSSQSLDTGTEHDTLIGGAGDDRLAAGYGDDVDGGASSYLGDYLYISFLGAPSGITADFSLATQTIGGGTITGIENLSWVQGSNYDDTINAEDRSTGYSQMNTVLGMGGNDHLIAGYYTDMMDGGDGDDIVDGHGSQYLRNIYGGTGDDTIYVNPNAGTAVYGGDGNDTIYGSFATSGGAGDDTIIMYETYYRGAVNGDDGNDTITASDWGNTIAGGAGADVLTGGNAADQLGSGDYVPGSLSFADDVALEHDVLNGGGGDDDLSAGYGDDVDGGAGNDVLRLSLAGSSAGVTLSTNSFVAGVTIGGGTIQNIETLEYLRGTDFADRISTGVQDTRLTLDAGAGNDTITTGGTSVDVLGGAGNDRLISGPASDHFDGGDGIDTVDYAKAGAAVTVALGINGATGTGGGADELVNVENVYGSRFGDTLTGNEGANLLKGQAGDDVLHGGDGNDTLDGGTGVDSLYGGTGNDTYVINDFADTIYENSGEGTDTVKATISVTLGDNVENLVLSGSAAIDGTGNALANLLTGNNGANVLLGGDGNDTLRGGLGLDSLNGQEGSDIYIFASGGEHQAGEIADSGTSGIDEVLFSAKEAATLILFAGDTGIEQVATGTAGSTIAMNVDASLVGNALTMIGDAAANILTGTAFDDTIQGGFGADKLIGNAGNDVIDGGRDIDKMYGGTGDDTYIVDNASDYYSENAGEGTDTVHSSVSLILRANVENLELTGTSSLNGTGNALDNVITGTSGNNILSGADGNDTLDGGAGVDTLRGGNGDDLLIGGAGRDNLYGNAGSDTFQFHDGDFGGASRAWADYIVDFSQADGDRIDLHLVDAQTAVDGTQGFDFIGTTAFDGHAGELRFDVFGTQTYISGDTDGDGVADFMIHLNGAIALTSNDFVL